MREIRHGHGKCDHRGDEMCGVCRGICERSEVTIGVVGSGG